MDRRAFLITAAAGGALGVLGAGAPETLAAQPLEAKATRAGDDAIRLDWSAKGQPTSIYLSSDPGATRAYMREVKSAVRSGSAQLTLAASPRPYFLLATANGDQVRVAERLLPLQGGRNFRDLGGYLADGARQVRWGRLYRSGVMSGLTPKDLAYLSGLGIQAVCDLRSVQERTSEPSPFLTAYSPEVAAFPYEMGGVTSSFAQAKTRAEAVSAFAAGYLALADTLTPQYTDMFARLVRGDVPLAVNCSAGKDRTGIASALILSVLGVPRETVIADYALSEIFVPVAYYQGQAKAGAATPTSQQAQMFAKLPPEVAKVILGSDPEVMRLALSQMDQKYGGPVELAKSRFGLTDAKVAYLRGAYLI
jgi:protein-tyrosine phosphatase